MAAQLAPAGVVEFTACLGRLGFNPPTVAFLNTQGLTRVADLMELPLTQMDELIRQTSRMIRPVVQAGQQPGPGQPPPGPTINIPLVQSRRLKAFRLWCNAREAAAQPNDADLFLDADVPIWVQHLADLEEAEAEGDGTKPPQLGALSKWATWSRKFEEHLLSLRSPKTGIPLLYLIRDHDAVTQDMLNANYESFDERMIAMFAFLGPIFEADNRRFYGVLKEFIGDGPGWAFIQPFDRSRNGRRAWTTLLAQTVGQSAVDLRVQNAHSVIRDTRYTGTSKHALYPGQLHRASPEGPQ